MPLKIVHISECWVGGVATYLKTLIDHQLKSDDFSEVSFIYSQNRTPDNLTEFFEKSDKLKVYPYQSSRNPLKFLDIIKQINTILETINPDIIHLHSTFAGVYGRLLKNKTNAKIVYCAHGWSFSQKINPVQKYMYGIIERYLAKNTDAIVNISRDELEAAQKNGVSCKINTVILNSVMDRAITNNNIPLTTDKNKINIGFIGRLDYQKGFDLIEAFFKNKQFKNIHLYVIGAPERVNGQIKQYVSCDTITYLGWINNKDIDSYIKKFDVIIVPSRYEGFGLVTIEAMRNQRPVIVSNQGALPELVIDGFNGYIFDLNNIHSSLSDVLEKLDKEKLAIMGHNAHSVYEANFTEKRFCNEMNRVYKRLVMKENAI